MSFPPPLPPAPVSCTSTVSRSALVPNPGPGPIAEEFFRVLGRHEALQNIFCDNTCPCPQFTQGMHLILPRWNWGVTKLVCFGLGSFRNVEPNGTSRVPPRLPYSQVPLTTANSLLFNQQLHDREDPVQVLIRHVAALDMVAAMRMCSNPRGIEHAVSKGFSRIANKVSEEEKGWGGSFHVDGGVESEGWNKFVEKLKRAYDKLEKKGQMRSGLPEVPIYFCDPAYTERDREVFKVIDTILRIIWRQPVFVVADPKEAYGSGLIDDRTMIYSVDPNFPVRTEVLRTCKPVAMVWKGHDEEKDGDLIEEDVRGCLMQYTEFKLRKEKGPHTIGSSHIYIRKDAIVSAWKWAPGCFPPWALRPPFDKVSMDEVADKLVEEGWMDKAEVANHLA